MRLHDLDTPLKRHGIMHYGSDGNKVVRHNYDMRPISGVLYKGEAETDEYGAEVYDIFVVYPNVRYGLLYLKKLRDREDRTTEQMEAWLDESGMGTLDGFLENLDEKMKAGKFIGFLEIEFVRQFDTECAERYASYRMEYKARKAEQHELERKRREAEDTAYVKEKNDEAESALQVAIDTIRSGNGGVENEGVEIFKSRYNSTVYALVNVLCRRYKVTVPLRTQGWIAEKLVSFRVRDGRYEYACWQSKKRSDKPSQSIHKCLKALVEAVRADTTEAHDAGHKESD